MKKTLKALLLGCVAFALVGPSTAEAADPGRTVLTFLKIGVGARAAMMGDAYVAVADDATASYWNPAGLLKIESNDVVGMHNEWIQDLRHEYAAVGVHRGRHGFGASFVGLYSDDIQARDDTGQEAGIFGYSDIAVSGSYAFELTEDLGVGGTIRYMRQSIDDENLSGVAFDFGGTWQTPVEGVEAGASMRHLGGSMSYDFTDAGSFDLPTTLQFGLAYRKIGFGGGGGLLLAGDILVASGDDASFRFGGEYKIREQFSVGAGYKAGLDNEDISFGLGYEKGVRLNYAFTPISNDLGDSHRFALGYAW
ncbi:MAG: PorV/PorQ family protein [Candidatus Eisenbacteria bacterium]|uniref:PorV/PorQ family protein n=1 Tax=Eiseniibacteriota bacterium TaxID=2212470 RepID=A0A7Y2E708_UNCEI|nr:PorV/PorQ family protein [Candidatus Eisenbacteria bacterium]